MLLTRDRTHPHTGSSRQEVAFRRLRFHLKCIWEGHHRLAPRYRLEALDYLDLLSTSPGP